LLHIFVFFDTTNAVFQRWWWLMQHFRNNHIRHIKIIHLYTKEKVSVELLSVCRFPSCAAVLN